MSVTDAATALGITRTALSRILNEKAGISADMALRLESALGTSAEMWAGMQSQYELLVASRKLLAPNIRKRLARTVLIFTEKPDQLSRATDRVPGLPASPDMLNDVTQPFFWFHIVQAACARSASTTPPHVRHRCRNPRRASFPAYGHSP